MKLIKKTNSYRVKLSRQEWEQIGRDNDWHKSLIKNAQSEQNFNNAPQVDAMIAQQQMQSQKNRVTDNSNQQAIMQIQQIAQQMGTAFNQGLQPQVKNIEQNLNQLLTILNNFSSNLKNVNQ